MAFAINKAKEAYNNREVPVGCVIVKDGVIIGEGANECEKRHDATAHAEMIAIKSAAEYLGDWRLDGCTLYVTMEPCPMCAGAIINSRIDEVVFGVRDSNKGAVGSIIDLFSENFGRRIKVFPNVMHKECGEILENFFAELR